MSHSGRTLALAMAILVGASIAYRAVGQPAGSQVGFADVSQLHVKSQAYKTATQDMQEFGESKREELRLHEMFKYLTGEEATRAVELGRKATRTPEENREYLDLRGKNTNRNLELGGLLQKAQRTQAEEQRLQWLQGLALERGKELEELRAEANQAIKAREAEWNTKLRDAVDKALAQIAQERGLTVILQKRIAVLLGTGAEARLAADEPVVLWGGTDVTEQLIQLTDAAVLGAKP